MNHESVPVVPPYHPLAPSTESIQAERLEYKNMEPAVQKHSPYEKQRSDTFWDSEPDSLEEQQAALQLARHYLLLTSSALNRTIKSKSADTWSDRFTTASTDLYGQPDPQIARELFASQQKGIEAHHLYENEARLIGEFLDEKYADVYEALAYTDGSKEYTASEVADKFEAALGLLQQNHDGDWGEWSIKRSDSASLSVDKDEKEISVGIRRVSMTPEQLKMLFTHEVLVHAQRSKNGYKRSEMLGKGLAGYEEIEEGFGVYMGYAATGIVTDSVQDRYVDIAYALGMIDGQKHTRQELIDHAMERATKRNEKSDEKLSEDKIKRKVYAHINRMYRGSRGDEHIGVFTKDIFYYKGFLDIGSYISGELEDGKSIDEIMDWLLRGKFDPTNEQHVAYVESFDK